MIRHHLQRHKYKVVVGVPIAVLIASSLSFMRSTEDLCIVPDDNRYVSVGETVTLHIFAQSDEPVNVVSGTVHIPTESLTVTGISTEHSIIDLWTEQPTLSEDGSSLSFSGGIISESGFLGSGIVATLLVQPIAAGKTTVSFTETTMLAHDGTGMQVACGQTPMTLMIRESELPSPDVNGDKVVNIFDFGIVSTRLFMAYNTQYDLNNDGKITLADVGIIVANMGDGGRMGSLALLWYR